MRKIASFVLLVLALLAMVLGGVIGQASASSHREAPYTATDPQVDATDLYAFVSPDQSDTVTLIANYIPFEIPASGPNFYQFGDDVLYEINVDNNGDARDDLSFQFRFRSVINNGDTFLYNTGQVTSLDDPDLNQEQFYSVSLFRSDSARDPLRRGQTIMGADNLQVAPYNVGPASFPDYGAVASQAIYNIGEGMKVFAGPRDDPFFIDLGGAFDLLQFRHLQGLEPVDDLAGLNVHSIALQVPISMLQGPGGSIIGVRTTSYRRHLSIFRPGFEQIKPTQQGPRESVGFWVQVSRLDMPLVNEVIIPLKDKNRWNASKPVNDEQFLNYVTNPELPNLINQILGVPVPQPPRQDLVTVFLTGVPGLNKPPMVEPASLLRLNMAIPPAAEDGENGRKRLGVLEGDIAGFPNGRRLQDDVVDIELQVAAGELVEGFANDLADKVDMNDVPFMGEFPYLAEPHDYTNYRNQAPN